MFVWKSATHLIQNPVFVTWKMDNRNVISMVCILELSIDWFCMRFVFCGRVPWLYQYWTGGFMVFVVLCPGTPEGSVGSGSGFKASQKTGQRLKPHPTDWERPGIEPATLGLQDIGLSPTPRRLLMFG